MSNNMDTLRQHLLDTLADLRNRDHPMEPDRARAIAQVAGVLVDSARVEIEFLDLTGSRASDFIAPPRPALPGGTDQSKPRLPERDANGNPLPRGAVGLTVHRNR